MDITATMLRISVLQKTLVTEKIDSEYVEVLLISFHQLISCKTQVQYVPACVCVHICVGGWVGDVKVRMSGNQCILCILCICMFFM